MAFTADVPEFEAARDRARKAMTLPIGLASPFWLAFGAAASAGVAFWWATRWRPPVNLEATPFGHALAELPEPETAPAIEAAPVAEVAAEVVAEVAVEPLTEPKVDDLTQLSGIGPKLAAALAERGITTFAQLAAWTEENAAAFDAELSLKGRVARDAWIAQARRLAGEG
jgi:predicted flap endonuclease-1-like 5' DNA nuclease